MQRTHNAPVLLSGTQAVGLQALCLRQSNVVMLQLASIQFEQSCRVPTASLQTLLRLLGYFLVQHARTQLQLKPWIACC